MGQTGLLGVVCTGHLNGTEVLHEDAWCREERGGERREERRGEGGEEKGGRRVEGREECGGEGKGWERKGWEGMGEEGMGGEGRGGEGVMGGMSGRSKWKKRERGVRWVRQGYSCMHIQLLYVVRLKATTHHC